MKRRKNKGVSDARAEMQNPYEQFDSSSDNQWNGEPQAPTPKKKGKVGKIIGIVVGVLVLFFAIILIVGSVLLKKTVDVLESEDFDIEITVEEQTEGVVDTESVIEEVEVIEVEETEEVEEVEIMEESIPTLAYNNSMLGIGFNYSPNLYMKENVEGIFNALKVAIPEDRTTFNVYEDKLSTTLNIIMLTTGDDDGLYLSVSLLPFEIEKETTTLKIDGSTEITNETVEAINLTDEELISKYDYQIQETLAQSGCEIISYNDSIVGEVGSDSSLRGIYTSRVYTGPEEVTTSTGTVDVVQCTIPLGKNALLVTAVSDGTPVDIDKSVYLEEIISSLSILVEDIVEEVEVEEVEVEETETVTE